MTADSADDEPTPLAAWRREAELTQPELARRLHAPRTHFTTVSKIERRRLAYFRGKSDLIEDWAQACRRDPAGLDVQELQLRSGNAPRIPPGTERIVAAFATALWQKLPRPAKPLNPSEEAIVIKYVLKLLYPELED